MSYDNSNLPFDNSNLPFDNSTPKNPIRVFSFVFDKQLVKPNVKRTPMHSDTKLKLFLTVLLCLFMLTIAYFQHWL
jgi:hypothetical protein